MYNNDIKIVLRGKEADAYILLRNKVAAVADMAKATASKVHAAVAKLEQLTK